MGTYATLVDTPNYEIQTTQELSDILTTLETELEDHDAELKHSYAVMGEHDFLVIFDVPDHNEAFKSALTLHQHRLSTQTMEIVDTDDFAQITEDI